MPMMKNLLTTTALVLVLLAIWQALHGLIGNAALTSPAATVVALVQLLGTGDFWTNVAETGRALAYALLIGLSCGTLLGVLLGIHRLSGAVAEPILLNLYALPKVTLYPLVLLIFGLGLSAKVAFGVMHGLIPVMTFTMHAIREMRPVYLRASRTMRLPLHRSVMHIVLPAIFPQVLAGWRLGFSLTLLGVLIGEMFASQHGLGHLLTNAMNLGDIRTIMAIALFLTLFALAVNAMLMAIDKHLQHR